MPRRVLLFTFILLCFLTHRELFAQVTDASVKATINKAAIFLKNELDKNSVDRAEASLAAYALIKAGENPDSARIQKVVSNVVKRCTNNYKPPNHGIYGAGVELMLLEAAGGKKYQQQMQSIVQYLIQHQHSTGGWDYVNDWRGGDTSQAQYALLGLWAAERAGIKVPGKVWDDAARWFLRAQSNSGGFAYHPLGKSAQPDLIVSHGMSAAGAGSLMIIRMHLFPNDKLEKPQKPTKTKFGVLEKVDLDTVEQPDGTTLPNSNNFEPTVKSQEILDSATRAFAWVANRFTVSNEISSTGHRGAYYLYTMERMAALFDTKLIAGRDWFREGAAYLMKTQNANGSWRSPAGEFATTSLAVLFFLRTTAKTLNRDVPLDPLGGGLLTGGRGLPEDLNQAVLRDGKVETSKPLGPIDNLLAELEKIEDVDIAATQDAIVEKVQLGDREELIKQTDRLVQLAKHPNAEVRRTAIWALGRTEDLRIARLLIGALDDNNVDVMVEARNALCILSRKPLGFGLAPSPFDDLPEKATTEQRDARVKEWREKMKEKWGQWYYRYRPYDERDDLSEALFKGK